MTSAQLGMEIRPSEENQGFFRPHPGRPQYQSVDKEFGCGFVLSSFWSSDFDRCGKGDFCLWQTFY